MPDSATISGDLRGRAGRCLLPLLIAFFVVSGILFLPIPGLHYDEILFLHPYLDDGTLFVAKISGTKIPVMVMSYVGALKTWLYWPVYTWLEPSVWALRMPMLLLGALNLWLIFWIARRLWSRNAALFATAAAATDPTFLLTQVFDWGPVTLQIFLMLGSGILVLRYLEKNRSHFLYMAMFFAGLAFWNKATYVWTLAGFAAATTVCWPSLFRRPRFRLVALAALSFAAGAAPFLAYNYFTSGETYRQEVELESNFPAHKLGTARTALDGSGIATNVSFFSVWAGECVLGATQRGAPAIPVAYQYFPERTWLFWYFLGALLVLLLRRWPWSDRPALWLMAALLVSVCSALATSGAGTGLHHYAPLLPLVFLLLAAAWHRLESLPLPRLSARLLLLIAIALPVQSSLSLTGWYLRADTCGGRPIWSDATEALAHHILRRPGCTYYIFDWGIDEQLKYFTEKQAAIRTWDIPAEAPDAESPQERETRAILVSPATRVIRFTPAETVIRQRLENFEAMLARHGYETEREALIVDRRGHPLYEVLRLVPKGVVNTAGGLPHSGESLGVAPMHVP